MFPWTSSQILGDVPPRRNVGYKNYPEPLDRTEEGIDI
jgi:hypothetical protein